jgi:hypothetical protein
MLLKLNKQARLTWLAYQLFCYIEGLNPSHIKTLNTYFNKKVVM